MFDWKVTYCSSAYCFGKIITILTFVLSVTLLPGCAGVQPSVSSQIITPSPSPTPNGNATTFVYVTEGFLGPGDLVSINIKDGSMTRLGFSSTPGAIAVTRDGLHAYVAVPSTASIAVADTQKNEVETTIPVGRQPSGIALSPDGHFAYVANMGDGTVSIIKIADNAVVNTIFTDSAPEEVAFSADGRKAYVNLIAFSGFPIGGPHQENALVVIDTATQQILKKIPAAVSHGMVASPTRREMYLLEPSFGMAVLDTSTDEIVAQIKLDNDQQMGLAVSADGQLVYVIEHGMIDIGHQIPPDPTVPSTLYIISAEQRLPVAKAQTDPGLIGISLSPDDRTAYLISDETSAAGLRIFDTQAHAFGLVQPVGGDPTGLTVGRH
jgi:YVTN family beta-propeller protein